MKVGIITLFGENYGAVLQAYALRKKLEMLGYDAQVINYVDKDHITYGMPRIRLAKFYLRKAACLILTQNKKRRLFSAFRAKYIRFSPKRYHDFRNLKADPPMYDIYISGSDQVWNPSIFQYDFNFLLDFVPEGKRRISYAASFGKRTLPKGDIQRINDLLHDYDALSVREDSGRELLKTVFGLNAQTHLDPTLLLNAGDWGGMLTGYTGKYRRGQYIVCYYMPGDRAVCNAISKIASQLNKVHGYKVIKLGMKEHYKLALWDDYDVSAGPLDFIALFYNASYVVTNSFHGVSFAINFNKPFFAPINSDIPKETALHERIISLVEKLGLRQCIVPVSAGEQLTFDTERKIDYHHANMVLEGERRCAEAYLKSI